jgi:hypothetical protein
MRSEAFEPETMTVGGKRWAWSRRRAIVHFRRLTRIHRRCVSAGLNPVILRYEQMLRDPEVFWQDLATELGQPDRANQLLKAFGQQKIRKVRGDSASLYENYSELLKFQQLLNLSEREPLDLVSNRGIDQKLCREGLKLRLQEWMMSGR